MSSLTLGTSFLYFLCLELVCVLLTNVMYSDSTVYVNRKSMIY